jgi:hypothetical protein
MSNLISLYGAVKVNGIFIATYDDFLQDCPASQIVSVQLVTIQDINGNDQPSFWVRVINPQGLTVEDVFLATNNGLLTLDNFASGLAAQSATNKFTKYTDLVRGSDIDANLVEPNTDMLFNDFFTIPGRTYNPNEDQTIVSLNVKNRLSYTVYVFEGDQTYAGDYTYFTSTGNS